MRDEFNKTIIAFVLVGYEIGYIWSHDTFPASRGLLRRGKMKREERDLCRLSMSCLMKPPTKLLVETFQFSKPVSFNV